jgi:hypothetical protein
MAKIYEAEITGNLSGYETEASDNCRVYVATLVICIRLLYTLLTKNTDYKSYSLPRTG